MTDHPAPEPNAQAVPAEPTDAQGADLLAEKYGAGVLLLREIEARLAEARPVLAALAEAVDLTGSRTIRDRSQGCAGRTAIERQLKALALVRHSPLPPPDQPLPCPLHWNRPVGRRPETEPGCPQGRETKTQKDERS